MIFCVHDAHVYCVRQWGSRPPGQPPHPPAWRRPRTEPLQSASSERICGKLRYFRLGSVAARDGIAASQRPQPHLARLDQQLFLPRLEGVAPLVADSPRCNSTTRQNLSNPATSPSFPTACRKSHSGLSRIYILSRPLSLLYHSSYSRLPGESFPAQRPLLRPISRRTFPRRAKHTQSQETPGALQLVKHNCTDFSPERKRGSAQRIEQPTSANLGRSAPALSEIYAEILTAFSR